MPPSRLVLLALLHSAAPPPTAPPPPATRATVVEETVHGRPVKDAFRWLEDEKAPDVQAWMNAQDAYARAQLAALPGREALTQRYKELYYIESMGAPLKRGGRLFYSRRHKDKEKAVIYWRQGTAGAEKVLLDPNTWSKDNTVSLGVWVPSWDGRKVVFAERPNAADEATLHVLDVDSGKRSAVDVIPGGKYASPTWARDNKGFYYERLPVDPSISVSERPGYTVFCFHALGSAPQKDPVLHEKTGDPATFLGGSVSNDGQWLMVNISRGWNENDVYFRRVTDKGPWKLLVKGADATYGVTAWNNVFYVLTDEGAPNLRVFSVDPAHPERAAWKERIAEQKDVVLQDISVVGGQLVVSALRNVVSEIRIHTLDGAPVRTVELPGLGTTSHPLGTEDDDEAFFTFSSFTMPQQVFRTSVRSGKSDVWSAVKVPVDPSAYTVEQVFYPSRDGTRVPMFLVRRKDLKKDGSHPVLLYGYGGFSVNLTSTFQSFIYPWLEAGGVYAVPNLRGGGEFGKAWHDAGKGALKQNVFDDFAAAAEFLVKEGYTRPERLAVRGGSNGGLLVGALMAQRPELVGAVICAVPLLDMTRYHLFGSGKTWIPEYGNPEVAADSQWLSAYSPYQRLTDGVRYPALLMMSADHDDRVDPMHARKFVARVQQASTSRAPAWLRVERNAGHGGADQVAKGVESSVDQVAFLLSVLKVQ